MTLERARVRISKYAQSRKAVELCNRLLLPHQRSMLLAELARRSLANMDIVKGLAQGRLMFPFRHLLFLSLYHFLFRLILLQMTCKQCAL